MERFESPLAGELAAFRKAEFHARSDPFERHDRIGELARIGDLRREMVRKLIKNRQKEAHNVYTAPESAVPYHRKR